MELHNYADIMLFGPTFGGVHTLPPPGQENLVYLIRVFLCVMDESVQVCAVVQFDNTVRHTELGQQPILR